MQYFNEDNFYDFLLAFLYNKHHLERGLLWKERICSQGERILSV